MIVGALCSIASVVFLLWNSEQVIDNAPLELTTNSTQEVTTTYVDQSLLSNDIVPTITALPSGTPEVTTTTIVPTPAIENTTTIVPTPAIENTMTDLPIIPNQSSSPQAENNNVLSETGSHTSGLELLLSELSSGTQETPRADTWQQYMPDAHIAVSEDKQAYIMHSPSDLVPLAHEWLVVPSFDTDSTLANTLRIETDIYYRSYDNQIQVTLPKNLVVQTLDGMPFDTQALGLARESGYDSSIVLQVYDPTKGVYKQIENMVLANDDKVEFHFGIPGQHLIFSKPLEVSLYSDQPEGTLVEIQANHANQWRSKEGISIDGITECNSWVASLPGTISRVTNSIVTFYICGASVFALTYTGGANNDNFADASFKDKAVAFLTGAHFPTWSMIDGISIAIDRRPVDGRDPARVGTGTCSPEQKYFTLTHNTGGASIILIASWQLTDPSTNCPRVLTTFVSGNPTPITGRYYTWFFAPTTWQSFNTFLGTSPMGSRILRMGDTVFDDWVILYGFTITISANTGSAGWSICIFSDTAAYETGTTIQNDTGSVIRTMNLGVEDLKGADSGYYTTIAVANMLHKFVTWEVLYNTNFERKADSVVLLTGNTNSNVVVGSIWSGYTVASGTNTFIRRDPGSNTNKTGGYASKLRFKANIPAYSYPGFYYWNFTYTLYEN